MKTENVYSLLDYVSSYSRCKNHRRVNSYLARSNLEDTRGLEPGYFLKEFQGWRDRGWYQINLM